MNLRSTARFPQTSAAIREARRFVVDEAAIESTRREDLALAVSELAANAVLHARTPFVVTIERDSSSIRVGVTDGDPSLPIVKDHDVLAATGRGLRILEQIVSRWWIESTDDSRGKTVWFELDLDEGAP
jgi:anti-sigma regulatory factor (Ser/Thr protein kinase)